MINCPEFRLDSSIFDVILSVFAALSLIINPYVIYSIIWRSTSQMKTYRWFLLYHQITVFITDITIGLLAKPALFFPFPMGYPRGWLRGVIEPKSMLTMAIFFIEMNLATSLHLFVYRYEAAKRTNRIFPRYFVVPMLFGYCLCLVSPTALMVIQEDQEILRRTFFHENYSCITDTLLRIESLYILDKNMVSKYGTPPLALLSNFYFLAEITFIFLTYKTLSTGQMSPKLRVLQRRLLFQLTLQAFLPFVLICIPGCFVIAIIAFEIFGCYWVVDVFVGILSIFGTIGGTVLIIMNPTYYNWLCSRVRRKNKSTRILPCTQS